MRNRLYILLFSSLTLSFSACNDDELVIPDSYQTDYYATNAVAELALSDQLGDLTDAMKMADGGNVVTLSSLVAEWNGTPLKDVTTSIYKGIVDDRLVVLSNASNHQFDLSTAPDNGGFFHGNLLAPHGAEPEQIVEKGLFNAALFNAAYALAMGDPNDKDIDGLVALFGATPEFKMSDEADSDKDIHLAKYAARMTPSSGGLYTDIEQNLIVAKAAASGDFDTERDEALESFLLNWEKTSAAITSKYLKDTVDKISKGTDEGFSDGIHAYSEALGFMWGLRSIDSSKRFASNSQLDLILIEMNAPFNETVKVIEFYSEPSKLNGLMEAINQIQSVYGFTDAEMTSFETNWVKQEGR